MSRDVGCREAVSRLWRYLDDDLDDVDRQRVDQHLAWCLRCCGELEFARELRAVMVTGTEADIPDEVRTHLEAFIDQLPEGAEPT